MTVCGSSTGATRSKGLYKSSAFTGCNTICPWEAFSGMLFCTSVKLQAFPLHFCVLVTISILGSVFKYLEILIFKVPPRFLFVLQLFLLCIETRTAHKISRWWAHVQDLTKLNRDLSHVIYLSGHAVESCLQPENALPVKAWKLENDDTALLDLLPFLECITASAPFQTPVQWETSSDFLCALSK